MQLCRMSKTNLQWHQTGSTAPPLYLRRHICADCSWCWCRFQFVCCKIWSLSLKSISEKPISKSTTQSGLSVRQFEFHKSLVNCPASYGCQIDLHFKEANISSLLLHQLFNLIQSNVVNISHRDICAVYKTAQWFQSLVCYCMCHLLYICSRLVLQSVGLAACLIAKLQVSLYLY